MRRRRFIQSLVAAPVVSVIAQQAGRQQTAAPLTTVAAEMTAEPAASAFFNAAQVAALRKLGGMLIPPLNGHPGALESGAPEFLDFLVSVSPPERQKRIGTDSTV